MLIIKIKRKQDKYFKYNYRLKINLIKNNIILNQKIKIKNRQYKYNNSSKIN